jgi:hypothetical protein
MAVKDAEQKLHDDLVWDTKVESDRAVLTADREKLARRQSRRRTVRVTYPWHDPRRSTACRNSHTPNPLAMNVVGGARMLYATLSPPLHATPSRIHDSFIRFESGH